KSFFFFQAEDGIRDRNVTGVQTCALPISVTARSTKRLTPPRLAKRSVVKGVIVYAANSKRVAADAMVHATLTSKRTGDVAARSEIGRASCRERGEISVAGV